MTTFYALRPRQKAFVYDRVTHRVVELDADALIDELVGPEGARPHSILVIYTECMGYRAEPLSQQRYIDMFPFIGENFEIPEIDIRNNWDEYTDS